ncbi:DUF7882 family protein [Microterricola pindariensis]|uniref:DUF7882 domain-containing protein n=1 Tax=Microterricola pindariensis TaxID=478010 RepID=A0ABX5AZE5_9MICO|nr:hypothetical protein [Microterricola pindariensis]PPL19734.1 hypothetical protein GY24_04540 [Microterricola pindariensis]
MGSIIYGGGRRIQFDDRTLAHLQRIIVAKLRRQESFTLSWQAEDGKQGRFSLWIHPSIPLQFEFDEAEQPDVNREWLTRMLVDATASGEVRLAPEPVAVSA